MAILVDEKKLRSLLDKFADDIYDWMSLKEIENLKTIFIEECKKTS